MPARLPNPGGDANHWGDILNNYLRVSHQEDGTLNANTVGMSQVVNDAIGETKLSSEVRDLLHAVGGPQGPVGATGPTGPIGPTGLAGAVGATGPSGANGTNGAPGAVGATGATGVAGPAGATGPAGAAGAGVPVAGTTGQLLAKASDTDYATEWVDAPTVAASGVVSVLVTTGSEARPDGDTVLWIGGNAEPTNMANGDLWFSPTIPTDTEAPTAPTNLQAASITSNSFTLSWTSATDNIGVTAYEIFLDGISHKIVAGTSTNIVGRNGNTTYSCTVRARDGAGNWGSVSANLDVTTLESIETDHTVFASAPIPALSAIINDNGDLITCANGFYVDAGGWSVKAGRIYVPTGASTPATAEVYLFTPSAGTAPDLANPAATVTLSSITAGQWNEVEFASPVNVSANTPFWIGYRFETDFYFSTTSVGTNAVQATDGSELYLMSTNVVNNQRRHYYRLGSGATQPSSIGGQSYGIDVIVTEV